MKTGNTLVEQISKDLSVVKDYDQSLSPKELRDVLLSVFPNSWIDGDYVYGKYDEITYCIYSKNITYLGTPHPLFKKRIQIGDKFKKLYYDNESKGIVTLLIGIYTYGETNVFVDFDTTKYCKGKAHNSSAHVYTIDLKNTQLFGVFQKTDARENIITGFTKDNVCKYLQSKLIGNIDLRLDFIQDFDNFFSNVNKDWYGISCYKEMIENDFPNKYQPEWSGFYFEFKIDEYIKSKSLQNHMIYSQNKKKGEIDLDMFFPQIGCYGDLKCHSNTTDGIQGNDLETINSVLENSSIYYIVCNHDTVKDSQRNYEVTKFWNTCLKKSNLLSYCNKMKNSVHLTSYRILEINKDNMKYLDVFRQGHNSNGQPREPKIKIKNCNINNFLIHEVLFE